jgi:hypothetical protein
MLLVVLVSCWPLGCGGRRSAPVAAGGHADHRNEMWTWSKRPLAQLDAGSRQACQAGVGSRKSMIWPAKITYLTCSAAALAAAQVATCAPTVVLVPVGCQMGAAGSAPRAAHGRWAAGGAVDADGAAPQARGVTPGSRSSWPAPTESKAGAAQGCDAAPGRRTTRPHRPASRRASQRGRIVTLRQATSAGDGHDRLLAPHAQGSGAMCTARSTSSARSSTCSCPPDETLTPPSGSSSRPSALQAFGQSRSQPIGPGCTRRCWRRCQRPGTIPTSTPTTVSSATTAG